MPIQPGTVYEVTLCMYININLRPQRRSERERERRSLPAWLCWRSHELMNQATIWSSMAKQHILYTGELIFRIGYTWWEIEHPT